MERRKEDQTSMYFMRRKLEAEMAAEQPGATIADKEEAVKWRAKYNDWAKDRGTVWAGEEKYINEWKTAAKKT
jgi:hypothetical protein